MARPFRARRFAWVFGLAAALFAAPAGAQSRVEFLADQIRNASDFRVRTQAALALGASNDAAAVKPLCDGLDDANETVRSAAAAGLGKLGKKDGIPCLKAHAGDSSASVKSVVERSLKTLESGGAAVPSKPPPPAAGDTVYVAVGPTTNRTGRAGTGVADLVKRAMVRKLLSLKGYAVAPDGEAPASARAVIARHKLKGFFLQTSVEKPVYDDGKLVVQVRITMWTYPGKALQGEFSPKLEMSNPKADDVPQQDSLIQMAVESGVDSFAKVVASLN